MASEEESILVEEISEEEAARRKERGLSPDVVRVQPGDILMPHNYRHLGRFYRSFEFRSDDVVILTYPKSGTHWMFEIMWAIRNADHLHMAEEPASWDDVFFIDRDLVAPYKPGDGSRRMEQFNNVCVGAEVEDGVMLQLSAAHRRPRLLFTHLQLHLLNPALLHTCKVIHVARNPKDVCLSLYHHLLTFGKFKGEFPVFFDSFLNNEMIYGSYWDHLRRVSCHKNHSNLHLLLYEDMKSDPVGQLMGLATFLELDLTQEQLTKIADHCSFSVVKARCSKETFKDPLKRTLFLREGRTGGWKEAASRDMDARIDAWIKEHSLSIDFTLKHQICPNCTLTAQQASNRRTPHPTNGKRYSQQNRPSRGRRCR